MLKEESGIVLVLIPGGTFAMGAQETSRDAPNYDPEVDVSEGPVHEVELAPFFLSKYELTLGQWQRFTGVNPNQYHADFYNPDWSREGRRANLLHPVEQVSWTACARTLTRLGLALPTEAQWEYAARAGTTSVFWTGNDVASLRGAANLSDAYGKAHGNQGWPAWEPELDDGQSVHGPVGATRANPFGLHDVIGNVMEWCRDGWVQDYYARSPRSDPLSPPDSSANRISRGGSFSNKAVYARSAFRSWSTPDDALNNQGCRPALAIVFEH
jgi:formylglycine-generating enzyme required for sulfatase activity